MNLLSTKIKIFPAANRSYKYDAQSRLMSEKNLTDIVKALAPKESFVISNKVEAPFKFVIGGYFVVVDDISELLDGSSKYAYIITKPSDNYNLSILQGEDSDISDESRSEYTGVSFTSSIDDINAPEGYSVEYLKIIEFNATSGEYLIPETSEHKYNYLDFTLDFIDCGNWDEPVDEEAIAGVYEKFGIYDWKLS